MSRLTDLFHRNLRNGNPASGLYHYVRETEQEKSRIHLRVDGDGHGTLIVNANSVMHLNPTAAFMAWLTLEGRTKEESVRALRLQYSVTRQQADSDLSSFLLQFDELIRPDGACPIHELDLDMLMPFSTRPSAPYRMDLAAMGHLQCTAEWRDQECAFLQQPDVHHRRIIDLYRNFAGHPCGCA